MTGDRAHFLDHGVDLEHFRRASGDEPAPTGSPTSGPRIGFFGGLDDYVVDFDLLERVAVEIPEAPGAGRRTRPARWSGSTRCRTCTGSASSRTRDIPAYGSGFDVALMPWLGNAWIEHSNPIKLKEYLALGLPVVSTDFPEAALSGVGSRREQPRRVHRAGPPDARGRWAGYP